MAKKGASQVFEQVLIFVISVVIFLIIVATLNNYFAYYTEESAEDQLTKARDIVATGIIKLSQRDVDYSEILIAFCNPPGTDCLPDRIANEYYTIGLSSSGIEVSLESGKQSVSSSLFELTDIYTMSGTVSSANKSLLIYKSQNQIIIT